MSLNVVKLFFAFATLIFAAGNLALAKDVSHSSLTLEPFTELEGSRRSLHVRFCLKNVVIANSERYGTNCARAKFSRQPGQGSWGHIILESRYFKAFDIVTSDRSGSNYKFWLQERSSDDTSNFNRFLSKQSIDKQAVVGALCKVISTYGEENFEAVIANYNDQAPSEQRNVLAYIKNDRVYKKFKLIAERCARTVERNTGSLTVRSASFSPKPSKSRSYNICNYEVTGNGFGREQIKNIQLGLKQRGVYSGSIDGFLGRGSCLGFDKFMSVEARTKVFNEDIYKRLLAKPSPAVLAQYNSTTTSQQLSASRFVVEPFDGRKNGKGNYTGAWVTLYDVKQNGSRFAKNSISFEFSGDYPNKSVHSIGLSSVRTFTKMPSNISEKSDSFLGYRFWLQQHDGQQKARSKYRKLDENDQLILRSICGLLADQRFVTEVISRMKQAKPFSYADYVDSKYNEYWGVETRISQLMGIANSCNLGIGNTGSNQISFDLKLTSGSSPQTPATEKGPKVLQHSRCIENRAIIRSNQSVLKDLGLYTSVIDGLAGPNYNNAVAEGEKLLGLRADGASGCLNPPERQILSAIYDAQRKGSICKNLLTVDEVKSTFDQLKDAELTKKYSLGHANVGGLIWMIDTVSDLEKRLSFTGFYSRTKTSRSDCRLDRDELNALKPRPVEDVVVPVANLEMVAMKTKDGAALELVVKGKELTTSLAAKSIFGDVKEVALEIRFATVNGAPALDFVVSEENTKINLHFFEMGVTNATFAGALPELFLDKHPEGNSEFLIRLFDNGKSNIDNGDFAKVLAQMSTNDNIMVSALCSQMVKISSSSQSFEASFKQPAARDVFRQSEFSRQAVQDAVGMLAKQCVEEIRAKGFVEAAFKLLEVPCTAEQQEVLANLDAKIIDKNAELIVAEDEISEILKERPLLDRNQCSVYPNQLGIERERLKSLEQQVEAASASLSDLNKDIEVAKDLVERLSILPQAVVLCDSNNDGLLREVNDFILSKNPVFVGVQCPDSADLPKSPIQIVIDEINATILKLMEKHISPDEVSDLNSKMGELEQKRTGLAAQLADTAKKKASPQEIEEQTQTNQGLMSTNEELSSRITSLKDEIRNLIQIMNKNASLIKEIDQLNQKLAELANRKSTTQSKLAKWESDLLQARARITQRELELDKVVSKTTDLEIQFEASSLTATTLQGEVEQLLQEIAKKQERVSALNKDTASADELIKNANSNIAQESQKMSKLDNDIASKNAQATILVTSVKTLGPQADAAEQSVQDLQEALKTDYVPVTTYQEKETRLNELTQVVTERTKLIRELRADLEAIQGEEQLMVKMCLADAQCKAVMGARLGVE